MSTSPHRRVLYLWHARGMHAIPVLSALVILNISFQGLFACMGDYRYSEIHLSPISTSVPSQRADEFEGHTCGVSETPRHHR